MGGGGAGRWRVGGLLVWLGRTLGWMNVLTGQRRRGRWPFLCVIEVKYDGRVVEIRAMVLDQSGCVCIWVVCGKAVGYLDVLGRIEAWGSSGQQASSRRSSGFDLTCT